MAAASGGNGTLVAGAPAVNTPNITPGADSANNPYEVFALAQVGSQIVVGGEFPSALPPGDTNSADAISVSNVMAFDQATGAISTGFRPVLGGGSSVAQVYALLPGPVVGGHPTVYMGGTFTTVNGASVKYLTQLDLTNGQVVPGFTPKIDGRVLSIQVVGTHMLLGGTFTHVQQGAVWIPHAGLASVNSTTGLIDPFLNIQVSGHHSYTGVYPFTATAPVGTKNLAVSPDGRRMIVDGNFKTAVDAANPGGLLRDQIMMVDLDGPSAAIDTGWATQEFDAACHSWSEDSWVRNVQYSPDGSYFVVAASGGDGTNADGTKGLCDSASRWESNATGSNVQPTWADWSGRDTLYSVAVTANAVFVGGHQRWMNNSNGHDSAGPGAVPRAGVAALDPVSGVPYSWNPGRTPRGAGTYALLSTPQGVYTGSDTASWGPVGGSSPPQAYRGMVAFFPTGGATLPSTDTGALPANVFLAGAAGSTTGLQRVYLTGSTAGAPATVPDPGGIDWSQVRGDFLVGNQLFYGYSDGNFYRRTFDGGTLGARSYIDPYEDPVWANVNAGGGGTYLGKLPTFYGTDIPTATGMLYYQGRLYWSQSGKKGLRYRTFNPESGIVGSDKCVAGTTTPGILPCVFTSTGTVDFSAAYGMFLSGTTVYWSDSSGNLHSAAWNAGNPDSTTSTIVSGPALDGHNWKSQGMFVLAPPAPTAAFTSSCVATTCTVNGTSSTDPGTSIASYAWDFGDGTTGTGATASHTYGTSGSYAVTLTVTNPQGLTGSVQNQVSTTAIPPPTASFVPSCTAFACTFDGTGSTSPGATITSYAWDYGDGSTDSGATAAHSYSAGGNYTVTLTVTNDQGQTGTSTQQVGVAETPTASFTATCTALACGVDGSASTAPGSSITSYAWTFGDGATSSGPSATSSHTYATAGTDTVTLTVTNAVGATAVTSQQVTVAPAPIGSFAVSCNQLVCSVDGSSSTAPASSIASYSWAFGDGGSAVTSGPTTTYPYAGAGPEQITLTVTNALGTSSAPTVQTVFPGAGTSPITAVGNASTTANATTESVTVPPAVTAGNGLILIASSAVNSPQTAPAGWTLVGTVTGTTMYSTVWRRVAGSTDASTKVTVTFGTTSVKGTLQLLAYAGTSMTNPVLQAVARSAALTTTTFATPTTSLASSGAWVVSYWAMRSTAVTTLAAPAGQTARGSANGTGGGHINSLITDPGAVSPPGTVGGLTATSDIAASGEVAWTIVLAPSP